MACITTSEVSAVLEDYLLQSAMAVATVAKKVEDMPRMTPQDAQVLSAVLLGTPKPSASDVVSLVNHKRRKVKKEDLPADLLSAISVSRFSQEYMVKRTSYAVGELWRYIQQVPVPGRGRNNRRWCGLSSGGYDNQKKMINRMRDRHSICIGLTPSGKPIVDTNRYKLEDSDSTTDATVDNERVKKKLKDIFLRLQIDDNDLDTVIKLTKNTNAVEIASKFADSVKSQLIDKKSTPEENTLTEICMDEAIGGVYELYNMFKENILKSASQLTKEEDINKIQNGMHRCMDLIIANALERVTTALLFYSCFRVIVTPQEQIGHEGGAVKKLSIKRRNCNDIHTALCFFFQSFPVCYADILYCIVNTPNNHKSYAERHVMSLLTGYSNDPVVPWTALNEGLNKKREIARNQAGVREDVLECRLNLSSPMYVVINDALDTFRELVEGLENFLIDVRDKQILFDNFSTNESQAGAT